jgi:ABC-2 type transport system ATP-binding protein
VPTRRLHGQSRLRPWERTHWWCWSCRQRDDRTTEAGGGPLTTIRAEALVKRFSRQRPLSHVLRRKLRSEIRAVDGISFEVAAGEFVGYAGPNGAGKSTTVKMLSGILTPSEGRVIVDGLIPVKQRRQLAKRIGVVFGQRTQLWWDLPLTDSFDLVRHLYGMQAADWRRRLDELTDMLALGPLLARPVRTLSLGQRMRADLAAAVLPAPRVLFLDEPTIGLDVEAKAAVRVFLRDLNARDDTTVLLTTHDLDDITELCSRLVIIDHGRMVYDGTVESLRDAYGTTRVLVVDLADPAAVLTLRPGWDGTELVRAEGHRRWIRFARDRLSAAELVARILADHEVADISIVEPDIEDIIRRIYRGETAPVLPADG